MIIQVCSIKDKETKDRVYFSLVLAPMQGSKKIIEDAIESAIGSLDFYDRRTLKTHSEMFVPKGYDAAATILELDAR